MIPFSHHSAIRRLVLLALNSLWGITMKKTSLLALALLSAYILGGFVSNVTAQPGATLEAKPDAKTTDADEDDRHAPLPNYFGKIGVSDEQREKLYGVQDDYTAKIEPLQKQIKALLKERDAAMEDMLTAGQKLRLKELRQEARARAAEKSKEKAKEDADATGEVSDETPAEK